MSKTDYISTNSPLHAPVPEPRNVDLDLWLHMPVFPALAFDMAVASFKPETSLCWSLSFNFHRRIIIAFPTTRDWYHTNQEKREFPGESGQLCEWDGCWSRLWTDWVTVNGMTLLLESSAPTSTRSTETAVGWGVGGLHPFWNLPTPFTASEPLQCCSLLLEHLSQTLPVIRSLLKYHLPPPSPVTLIPSHHLVYLPDWYLSSLSPPWNVSSTTAMISAESQRLEQCLAQRCSMNIYWMNEQLSGWSRRVQMAF